MVFKNLMSSLSIAVTVFASGNLWAQDKKGPDFIEEGKRLTLQQGEREVKYNQDFLIGYGGWFSSDYIYYDDDPSRDDRTLRIQDLRVWGDVEAYKKYHAYVRVLNQYVDYNQGDQYRSHDNRLRPLRLDQGFVDVDLLDLGKKIDGGMDALDIRAGRQFLQVGSGLALNNICDGVRVKGSRNVFNLSLLGARTRSSDDDIDQSRPNSDESVRYFTAAEFSYLGLANHRPYAFLLIQRDGNEEEPKSSSQDYTYNSEYTGIGVKGKVVANLSYHGEFIYETGRGPTVGSTEKEDIRAWAFTGSLKYTPAIAYRPIFSLEYLRGTGDKDRTSTTNTDGGNTSGSDDNNFLYFGYVQTGFSLYPRLSNLEIYKAGVSAKPAEHIKLLKDFETGAFLYHYRKLLRDAGISDTRSTVSDKDVGNEIDFYVKWRMLSDLGFTLYFGRFFPGDAYDSDNDAARNFFNASLTYSF